jgi:hypothetical protein
MEMTMQLSRTHKGHEEIFNNGHTLRPRQRHILFSMGSESISFGELCKKLPHCAELEAMISELLQHGFVQVLRGAGGKPTVAPVAAPIDVSCARAYALDFMADLVGTRSPAYRQMSEVTDMAGLATVLPMCRKVIAAVASPRHAAELEAGVAGRLGH